MFTLKKIHFVDVMCMLLLVMCVPHMPAVLHLCCSKLLELLAMYLQRSERNFIVLHIKTSVCNDLLLSQLQQFDATSSTLLLICAGRQ